MSRLPAKMPPGCPHRTAAVIAREAALTSLPAAAAPLRVAHCLVGLNSSALLKEVPLALSAAGCPHVVLLHMGTNDFVLSANAYAADADATASNTLLAVRHIRERCPDALLLLALLQPFYTEGGLLACRTRPS